LISGASDQSIKVFNFDTKEEIHQFETAGAITSMVLTSDNKFIISGSGDGSIQVFDIQTKQEIHHFQNAHQSKFVFEQMHKLSRVNYFSCDYI